MKEDKDQMDNQEDQDIFRKGNRSICFRCNQEVI